MDQLTLTFGSFLLQVGTSLRQESPETIIQTKNITKDPTNLDASIYVFTNIDTVNSK